MGQGLNWSFGMGLELLGGVSVFKLKKLKRKRMLLGIGIFDEKFGIMER